MSPFKPVASIAATAYVLCAAMSLLCLLGACRPSSAQTLNSISVSPAAVVGGKSATLTVTLSAPAPVGGAAVSIASSDAAAATIGSPVVVPQGDSTYTFTMSTTPVQASVLLTIVASYEDVDKKAKLTVEAPSVKSVAVKPASVTGGEPATGTITLTGPAPKVGCSVVVAGNDFDAATIASPVVVVAGATTATFNIATTPVATAAAVTITATAGVSATAKLEVAPPAVKSVGLSPGSTLGGVGAVTGSVTLTGDAPSGGMPIDLASSDPSAATVPATAVVPAGSSKGTFKATPIPVATATKVTIAASIAGAGKTAQLTVIPPAIKSVGVNPTSVTGGTESSLGTVVLTGPAPSTGLSVDISSGDTDAATVTSPVLVGNGNDSTTFVIDTLTVSSSTSVTISAEFGGIARTAALTVTPDALPESFGQGDFNTGGPCGIAIDPNSYDIYVTSTEGKKADQGSFVKFDQYGDYLATLGTSGKGTLESAGGIAVDTDGNVYVGDYTARQVAEFDKNGVFVRAITGASSGVTLGYITGLAVDSRGTLYVADWFGSRIVEFNQKGAVVRQFTTVIGTNTTTSPGTIGIALDPTETTLWVADSGYHVFTAYTLTGRLVANYGNYESSTAGVMPGFFNYPYGVALDSSGYVYVSDLTINDIQEFDQSGNFQALEGNYGTGPGLFTGPTGVAVDRHGNVLVCDNGGSRIEVFTPPF